MSDVSNVVDAEVVDAEETAEEAPPAQEIRIRITDSNVTYDSQLALPEVVFWLDVVKSMILTRVVSPK